MKVLKALSQTIKYTYYVSTVHPCGKIGDQLPPDSPPVTKKWGQEYINIRKVGARDHVNDLDQARNIMNMAYERSLHRPINEGVVKKYL